MPISVGGFTVAALLLVASPSGAATDAGCRSDDCHGQLLRGPVVHEALRSASCGACHVAVKPHHPGAPGDEFELGSGGGADLCFSCHDPQILTEPRPLRARFWSGEVNLHRLHSQAAEPVGCPDCHHLHHATRDKLIRTSGLCGIPDVVYDVRIMSFYPTATGAQCVVTCHKPRHYDRTRR